MRVLAVLVALASLAACRAPQPAPSLSPMGPVSLIVAAVPLNASDQGQTAVGAFRYAGGIAITSAQTSRLHGLSDLIIEPDGLGLHAVGDEGDTLDARLVLDTQGHLIGISGAIMGRLTGVDGRLLVTKQHSDAEGLTRLGDGSRLVSLERDNHILRYVPGRRAPTLAPFPVGNLDENAGIEALAALPAAGPGAYLAGAEHGQIFLCRLTAGCALTRLPSAMRAGYGLTALAALQGNGPPRLAILHRAWDPMQGSRATLNIVDLVGPFDAGLSAVPVAALTLDAPLTRDNFEGLTTVAMSNGDVRIYLITDDNFNRTQRTILMAFDWTPLVLPVPAPSPA